MNPSTELAVPQGDIDLPRGGPSFKAADWKGEPPFHLETPHLLPGESSFCLSCPELVSGCWWPKELMAAIPTLAVTCEPSRAVSAVTAAAGTHLTGEGTEIAPK